MTGVPRCLTQKGLQIEVTLNIDPQNVVVFDMPTSPDPSLDELGRPYDVQHRIVMDVETCSVLNLPSPFQIVSSKHLRTRIVLCPLASREALPLLEPPEHRGYRARQNQRGHRTCELRADL